MSNIDNLYDLSETITAVVNRALEVVTENSSSGQYYVSYDDVSDLISHEDFLQYFDFIVHELRGREEVLDLDAADHELDIVCGLAWCKNYEPGQDEHFIKGLDYASENLCRAPSVVRLAEIGHKAIEQIILRNGIATLSHVGLGVEEEELAYIRSITGYDKMEHVKLSVAPITHDSYENLLLTAEQQREQHQYDIYETASDSPLAFDVCVNAHGQLDEAKLADHPAAKAAYEQLFSQKNQVCDHRYGALISGKPAIVLDYALKLPVKEQEANNANFRNAVTAMVAAQLQQIFLDTNARITYGHSLGANAGGDIVAILPASADLTLVRKFEIALARTLRELPLSLDLNWAKKQYDAIFERVYEELPKHRIVTPWTKGNPEFTVVAAFASLGSRLGAEHREWRQALATHDTAKQARIADTFDLTKTARDEGGFDLLSTVVRDGIYTADADLSQRLCLYTNTNTEPGKEQFFTAPKGQILSAMKKMGYRGADIFPALIGYSEEMAVEIKGLIEQVPRPSLFQQMSAAQQRKDQNSQSRHKEKGYGKER